LLISTFIILGLVTLSILIHYEALLRLSMVMKHIHILPRLRIVIGLVGALTAHVLEVLVFAFAYYFLGKSEQYGELVGSVSGTLSDCIYFSFSSYTSLGFGDIIPMGTLRYVAGVEALLGLVLIAWTASFMYVEMQRFWKVP